MKRRASLLPFLAAAVLLAVRPAAAQVQVIIGGPDPGPAPRQVQSGQVQIIIGGPDPTPAPHAANAAHATHGAAAHAARAVAAQGSSSGSPASSLGSQVAEYALKYVGTPYVWGGAGPAGFDCSGYTQYVFRQFGIPIPRTADDQFAYGRQIEGDPVPGDLVFFQTYDWGASHVGVYLGNGYFVNSIGADVHVSSFASEYFTSRYLGARRFVRND